MESTEGHGDGNSEIVKKQKTPEVIKLLREFFLLHLLWF